MGAPPDFLHRRQRTDPPGRADAGGAARDAFILPIKFSTCKVVASLERPPLRPRYIFLGLGLPWLIYTAVWWTPYTSMQMQDPLALLEPIIILFVYIFLLLGVMLFSGWRLYPKVGYVLILLDLLFIAWSLLTHPLGGAGSTPVIAVNGR